MADRTRHDSALIRIWGEDKKENLHLKKNVLDTFSADWS